MIIISWFHTAPFKRPKDTALGRAQKKILLHDPSKVLDPDSFSVLNTGNKRMVNFMMFNGQVIIHITEYSHDIGVQAYIDHNFLTNKQTIVM